MTILEELNKLVEKEIEDEIENDEDEEKSSIKKVASKIVADDEVSEKTSNSDIGEIMNHIDAIKAAVEFVDKLTTDEAETTAFDAEIALRKALVKMQDLADEYYKKKKGGKE